MGGIGGSGMRRRHRHLSCRERRGKQQTWARRLGIAAVVTLLAMAAMTSDLKEKAETIVRRERERISAFAWQNADVLEVTLEEMPVWAVQLGAFDDGARAQEEMSRLMAKGIACILWRREQLCIVCSASLDRDALDRDAAEGEAVYVIREILPQVRMTISASKPDAQAAADMITLPDRMFHQLLEAEPEQLTEMIAAARLASDQARAAHPENELYTQLAKSLSGWCDLMEQAGQVLAPDALMTYAQVTMCTLCRELRTALQDQPAMEESTASAQRTPSTAADVMPPA